MTNPPLSLIDTELHLVTVVLESGGNYSTTLSDEEKQRASRFVQRIHGERFTVAHAALRFVLGLASNVSPAGLVFRNEAAGKPMLPAYPDIGFNLSHSEDIAVIALGRGAGVGVDVEHCRRKFDWRGIAESYFSPAERRLIDSAHDGAACFLQLWTAKEAVLKAIGSGLSALESVELTIDTQGKPRLLSTTHLVWQLHTFSVAGNHPVAIAHDGPPRTIRQWCLQNTADTFQLIEEK
ncbi:4'-phosphopantetheinyl transferase family protein [Chitinimonas sp. PSY-7]|uniref:4'-phosphopantetheinyl transferase superfamily protein n=1 Tax=Chitinimonas sp. PSY-7 TaxID=3459088 RepID=UPI00403FE1B2